MRLQFFSVPAMMPNDVTNDINQFCSTHRVIAMDKHLIVDGERSFWAICITWQAQGIDQASQVPKKGKVDYREVLNADDFAVFAKLRVLRKSMAEQQGVPAYALFTNEQLAEMVRRRVVTVADLAKIAGIGQSRIEKYAQAFLLMIQHSVAEQPVSSNLNPNETHTD